MLTFVMSPGLLRLCNRCAELTPEFADNIGLIGRHGFV